MKAYLQVALKEWGTKEITGDQHNPEVLKYFKDIGHEWVTNDELAWCAAFVNWCLYITDHEMTGKLNARSFLDLHYAVPAPQLGDIMIFWRVKENSPYGHVGFFINEKDKEYNILGGNQNNKVGIQKYPKMRLLGIRRPEKIK